MAPAAAQADLVEIFKGERRMELKRGGRLLKRYRVALGFAPERHKEREGDGRTPEGRYSIDARNPKSAFHLSLRVSYPDDKDRAQAQSLGVAPAATSTSTASPMAGASCSLAIRGTTGRPAASPSATPTSARCGRWCRPAPTW
jgi:hypothetical protein